MKPIEEAVISLLRDTLLPTHSSTATRGGAAKRRRDRALVERTRAHLARSFRESLSLEAIAVAVGASVYHLCRVFRAQTGSTLHQHVTDLRLRAALPELATGRLTHLALDLGFASHSHFTRQFRRRFGMPPSSFSN